MDTGPAAASSRSLRLRRHCDGSTLILSVSPAHNNRLAPLCCSRAGAAGWPTSYESAAKRYSISYDTVLELNLEKFRPSDRAAELTGHMVEAVYRVGLPGQGDLVHVDPSAYGV